MSNEDIESDIPILTSSLESPWLARLKKIRSELCSRDKILQLKNRMGIVSLLRGLGLTFVILFSVLIWFLWDNVYDRSVCLHHVGGSFSAAGHTFIYKEADYRWWGRKYTYSYTSRDLKTVKNLVRCVYRLEMPEGSPENNIIWMRALPGIMHSVLYKGTSPALFVDTDAIITRPVSSSGELVVSKEFVNGINTGYVFMKRNEKVLNMVKIWKDENAQGEREHDQDILQRLERSGKIKGVSYVPVFSGHIHTIYSAENWGKWPTFFFLRNLAILEMWTEHISLILILIWILPGIRRFLEEDSKLSSFPHTQVRVSFFAALLFLCTRTIKLKETGFWHEKFYGIPGVFRYNVIADLSGIRIDGRTYDYFNIGKLWSHAQGIFVYDLSELVNQIAGTIAILLTLEVIIYKIITNTKHSKFSFVQAYFASFTKSNTVLTE